MFGYIICWVAILKIKLYSSVNIIEKNGAQNFKLAQENLRLVSLFSPLANESLEMEEASKIESGLLNYLSGGDSGLGIKDLQDLSVLIKRFVDIKAELNLKKIKELILSVLMRNSFSLREKIMGYSLAVKMQNSAVYRQIRSSEIKAKAMINGSSVSKEAGDNLKDLFRSFRE